MVILQELMDESFKKLLKEIKEEAGDKEEEVERLLVDRIVKNFVNFNMKKSMEQRLMREQQESLHEKKVAKFDNPLLSKPKKNQVITIKNVDVPSATQVHNNSCEKKSRKQRVESENLEEEEVSRSFKKQKKMKKVLNFAKLGLVPPPPMPKEFKDIIKEMGGTEVKRIMQKQLFHSDIEPHNNRLLLPKCQITREQFLREEEMVKINLHINKGIEVGLIQPSLEDSMLNLILKKWRLGNPPSLVLTHKWNDVVKNERNLLKINAVVQLWSFRRNSKLCFALIRVRDGDSDASSGQSNV